MLPGEKPMAYLYVIGDSSEPRELAVINTIAISSLERNPSFLIGRERSVVVANISARKQFAFDYKFSL